MTRRASVGLWVVIGLSMACADARHAREPGVRPRATSDAGDVRLSAADAEADADTSTSRDAGSGGQRGSERRPRKISDQNTLRESEVWIGELWSAMITLCEVGVPLEELRFPNPAGQVARVVLVFDPDARGKAVGRIQFGDLGGAQLPASPDVDIFSGESWGSLWECSVLPTKGFEYTLFNVLKNDQGVEFEFSPNQRWNHWCETAKPVCPSQTSCPRVCVCKGDACAADLSVVVPVKLALKADTLEGGFALARRGIIADLRLKRAR